jgi:LPS sulfotransferase NodH
MTVLLRVLCTSPDIDCRGEVFSVTENNFAAYATDNTLPRPNDYPEAEKQLLAYVKYLHATGKHGVKAFGFDIKYNQLRSIAPTYESLCALPVLVQFIKESGTRVIHVVRENVLQAALSEMVAESRAVWHHTGHEEIERKVRIDCGRLLRNMLERRADRQIFASVMEGHSRMITCEYDRLSRGLAMADAEGNLVGTDNPLFEVADFLGVKPAFRDSKKLRKIANRPYRDVIENYDEVVRLVRRTEFVTHLDTI